MRPTLQPVAPSIDDPIELLRACHDKVRRFAMLLLRLREHVAAQGSDAQAQEAATAVLRYFDLAAPLHHDDEAQDLFPALARLGMPELNQAMRQLENEHDELAALWQIVRAWLLTVQSGQASAAPDALDAFAQRYRAHADREENLVYGHTSRLDAATIQRISAAMVARRSH